MMLLDASTNHKTTILTYDSNLLKRRLQRAVGCSVTVCLRAFVRICVCACARARVCVCVRMYAISAV